MNFELSSEEQAARQRALRFAEERLAPSVVERDEGRRWDPALFRAMGVEGLLGAPWPAALGGRERPMFQSCLMLEGVAEGAADAGLCAAWVAHSFASGLAIALFGSEAQKTAYLPRLASGEWLAAHCALRREAAADGELELRASRRGESWVLDGVKSCVINAPVAQLFVCDALTEHGQASFLVERDTPGVGVGPAVDALGLRTAVVGDVRFQSCALPADARLGSAHPTDAALASITRMGRAATAACWVGLLQASFNRCRRHVAEGSELGRPLREFQSARMCLADMRIQTELARRLAYRAALSLDRAAAQSDLHAASALIFACDALEKVASDAVRLCGRDARSSAGHAARTYRDSASLIAEARGASDALRSIVAGALVGLG
jgi:L-prolyl-PCP dehydrogenase